MKIVRFYGNMEFKVDEIEKPKIKQGHVLVKTEYCGICGSDVLHVLKNESPFFPNTFGHEFSGTVEEIGEGVTSVKPGDVVAVVPLLICHNCVYCHEGKFGQCLNRKFIGYRVPDAGGFSEYNLMPEENCLKMPDGINKIHAAFVEPASVAVHGLMRLPFVPGKDIAIVGAGSIGIMALQVAKAWGANNIYVFDIKDNALENAKKNGATHVYNTGKEGFLEQYLSDTEGGLGVPMVVEFCGLPSTVRLCFDICRAGGDIAIVGTVTETLEIPAEMFYYVFEFKEYNLHGVWQSYSENFPGDEWRFAARYLNDKTIDVEPMIYQIAKTEEANEIFADFAVPGKVKGKVLLHF